MSSCLTPGQVASIRAAVAAMPPMSDDEIRRTADIIAASRLRRAREKRA